jgi:hypothetical protein
MLNYKPPKTRRKPTDTESAAYDTEYNLQDGIPQDDDQQQEQEYKYTKSHITQVCFTDIDLAGQVETRQSTSGLMIYLNGIVVHWRARTERLIIQTTAAGEYVALNRGNTTAKFIRDVLQLYGNTTNVYHLYTDNQAAEHIATQPTMNEHSRAIDTRHHAIRQDYIENSMRIGGVASSDNTSDILTKNLQPHLHQRHCAALHILQPTLTQSNINLTNGSRESSGGEDMSLALKAANLKNSDWSPLHTKARKTLYTWASQMTQMTAMTTQPCGIDPFDPHLHHGQACHALGNHTHSEIPHTISPTSLEMSRRASKNVSQGQSVNRGDTHAQIKGHSNRPTTTPIPMDSGIVKPDFQLTSHADALSIPVRPKTPARPSKNDEAQKHEKTEALHQSANFVTVDNNLSQIKSQNKILSRQDPIFGERRKMHHEYLLAARNCSPSPPTLDEVFSTFHNSISTRTKMPAARHARQTSAASYKPYEPRSLDIHMLQASILDNIQQMTDFTYQDEVEMTPANLMVAIRLLVKCDLALETIESGLDVATPGSKYHYYRAVFLDYQDIIEDQKRKSRGNDPSSRRNQATSSQPDRRLCSSGSSGLASI